MTQEQIKRSEFTFRVIVEATPNVIVLINKEGRIVYVNNQAQKLLGYSSSELIGQMVERLIAQHVSKIIHYPESSFISPSPI